MDYCGLLGLLDCEDIVGLEKVKIEEKLRNLKERERKQNTL